MKIENSKLKIVFFGSSSYIIPAIKVLKDSFYLKLVLTTEKSGGTVPSFCAANKIKCLSVSTLSDQNIKSLISETKSSVGVLADFGLIVPKEILNIFPKGIVNIHPSLLPKYRGPSPVQTAILNGEKTTGVSIIKLDDQIDHGPILRQEKEDILEDDTAKTLYKRLFDKGANLLPNVINKYLKEEIRLVAQNDKNATFTNPLTRQDGFIDISKLKIKNSIKIENLKLKIRAYAPWPGVWFKTKLNGKEKIIKLLPDQKIQVEGKKPMTYGDLLNGYPEAKEAILLLL